ncbi:ribosome maturation factor RimM [Pontimonas sp.]|uniref:ribosome maturation factor RimM n=1 Tax=Pontimonas sp. TaxID=2304492 RepID=UPI0028707233|nr:ribosome maturation factor RimM [Pontimonas sp.]MDR9396851.1 ribosome maturation factor RimM [Pontimonas sp.]MDR9434357.1 ribosome maturation factor RimM [Pontimonas sp.]
MSSRKGGLPAPKPQRVELRVARLLKAHGLKGGLKLELYTDDPEGRFRPGAEVSVQVPTDSAWFGQKLTVSQLRFYNAQPVVFFDGVDDRTVAETLVRAILWVEQDHDAPSTESDAWFDHQLVGLEVRRDGARVGDIVRVDHLPAQDLLVVGGPEVQEEILLPFVRAFVPEVNTDEGFISVTPPGGIFDGESIDASGDEDDSTGGGEARAH